MHLCYDVFSADGSMKLFCYANCGEGGSELEVCENGFFIPTVSHSHVPVPVAAYIHSQTRQLTKWNSRENARIS